MTISCLRPSLESLPPMDALASRAPVRNERGHAPHRCGRGSEPRPEKASCESQVAALRYRRTERTALYVQTQEGDVVKLRIKVRDALAASSTSDGESQEISVLARSSTKISLHVEGDLNADELAAIRSVVEQAAALATDFFEGELPSAFAAASALQIDASQLARVGLKLGVREHATYASLGARPPAPPAPAPAAEPAPTATASAAAPAAEAAAPTPASATDAASPAPAVADATEVADDAAPVTDEPSPSEQPPAEGSAPAPSVPQPNVAAGALSLIADFLTGLLEALAVTPAEEEAASPSLDLSLRLHLYRATLVELAVTQPVEPAAASGVPLAAETLDALAAAQQAPLEAHA